MNNLDDTCAALHRLSTCLPTLSSITAENSGLSGGPQSRSHAMLEEAYAALGHVETVVDTLAQAREDQHRRLDEIRDDALSRLNEEQRTMPGGEPPC